MASQNAAKPPYFCEHCERTFSDPSNLQRHIRSAHIGARSHACSECGKTFATSSGLKQHQHIHSSVKPFQCEVCLRAYTQFSNLCRHKRMHADCRRQIRCKECGQNFSTATSLGKHRRFCAGSVAPKDLSPPQHLPSDIKDVFSIKPEQKTFYNKHHTLEVGDVLSSPLLPPSSDLHSSFAAHCLQNSSSLFNEWAPIIASMSPTFFDGALPGMQGNLGMPLFNGPREGMMCPPSTFYSPPLFARGGPYGESFYRYAEHLFAMRTKEYDKYKKTKSELNRSWLGESRSDSDPAELDNSSRYSEDEEQSGSNKSPVGNLSVGSDTEEENSQESVFASENSFGRDDKSFDRDDKSFDRGDKSFDRGDKSFDRGSKSFDRGDKSFDRGDKAKRSLVVTTPSREQFDIRIESSQEKIDLGETKHSLKIKIKTEATDDSQPLDLSRKCHLISCDKVLDHNNKMSPKECTARNTTLHDILMAPSVYHSNQTTPLASSDQVKDHSRSSSQKGSATPCHTSNQYQWKIASSTNLEKRRHMTIESNTHQLSSPKHAKLEVRDQSATSIGRERYKCRFCAKLFPRSANLTRHLRTHTGEQPYRCTHCDRSFSISSNLQRHVRNIHRREKPFKCHHCARTFGQQTNLDRHLRRHVNNDRDPVNLINMSPSSEETIREVPLDNEIMQDSPSIDIDDVSVTSEEGTNEELEVDNDDDWDVSDILDGANCRTGDRCEHDSEVFIPAQINKQNVGNNLSCNSPTYRQKRMYQVSSDAMDDEVATLTLSHSPEGSIDKE